ncbi:hypothetical protein F2Q68_00028137 [Brassica cretica]|uniref:Jacalin-type lectin domain-containing protein n=1 Tax=Brassica cretica TaxID=69181 RepID=A0A8S9IGL3_BRACR|nr:hypothetical protein F2Q68_00028137 [Brassica cretica]
MGRMYQKMALCGGEGGSEWDDGVYGGVKKVYVGQDLSRITYVKFEYVKEDGEVVTREYGKTTQDAKEFVIEYPDEHITAVEGSHNKVALIATEVITSLVFKTSKGRTSPTFGPNLFGVVNGTKFKFEDEGKKIVGFHGRSNNAIDALGVYFALESLSTPFPIYKLEAQGGKEGSVWDDGCFQGVRTFVVNFPSEDIKLVEVTYDNPKIFRNTVITSLKKQREGEAIDALGAYFEHIPIPIPPPVIGDSWGDYGIYDGVKKIKVGLYEEGIAFVKFVYIKGNGLVTGDDHGKITSLGAEEIVLENGEYLTGIEDYYRPIPGAPFGKTVLSSRRTKGRHLCMNWIPVRNTRLRRKATRSQGSMDELPRMLFTVWKPFPGQSS